MKQKILTKHILISKSYDIKINFNPQKNIYFSKNIKKYRKIMEESKNVSNDNFYTNRTKSGAVWKIITDNVQYNQKLRKRIEKEKKNK